MIIKEITQVVENSKYTGCVLMQESADSLIPQMKVIEADEFVDDDYDEEIRLTIKITEACKTADNVGVLRQHRTLPEGMSKCEHYGNIMDEAETLAAVTLFKNTKRFIPNYLMISSDILPVITFNKDFTIEPCIRINGIYVAGKYKELPVLLLPALDRGQMIWGVNDSTSPGIVTFVNAEGKICNKIVNPSTLTMIKLED